MMVSNFSEFDFRLREFLKEPDHFLNGIAFVNAFHTIPILVSEEPYAIEVDGQKVAPIFTTQADLEHFKSEHESANDQNWVERLAFDVMEEEIEQTLDGLAFNLKKDGDFDNSVIFSNVDLVPFLNNFTTIVNTLLTEENSEADVLEKVLLVPAFVHPRDDKYFDRLFPTMSTPEGKSYVPAFTNLDSFAKWYNNPDFGGKFRQAKGVVLTWTINDIYKPRNGENELDETFGVAINPFDDQQILVDWSDIESE